MKKALFWHASDNKEVECELCPHRCRIAPGRSGSCGVRKNRDGSLVATAYGLVSSSNVDPIEKKPLYHFRPGSDIFSIGGWGCNLHCSFCQNWSISQEAAEGREYSPDEIVAAAERSGTGAIAYTYNEPIVGLEFVCDCARSAAERGIRNVAVTNGYVDRAASSDFVKVVDAFNVDIKSMEDGFYRRNCGGMPAPVLEFCKEVYAAGKHLEITNLVIPGENDSKHSIELLVDWIAENLSVDVPVHFSAYRPQYRMTNPATGGDVLAAAYELAKERLSYVYLGNVISDYGTDTLCPGCGNAVIDRKVYSGSVVGAEAGCCAACGRKLSGFIWN